MSLTCTSCGKELPTDAKFCSTCGKEVPPQRTGEQFHYCSYCGYEHAMDAKFCLHCGKPIIEEPAELSHDYSIYEEVRESSPYYDKTSPCFLNSSVVLDFEKNKSKLISRANRWAEFQASNLDIEYWYSCLRFPVLFTGPSDIIMKSELEWFPTNKPNIQKALFIETLLKWFLMEAKMRGFIDYQGNFGPQVYTFYKKRYGWTDENLAQLRFDEAAIRESYKSQLDELAKKDDLLFPEPELLCTEVAGSIFNFTTWDAAVVVYMDSEHKGKFIQIDNKPKDNESRRYSWIEQKAEVIERPTEGGVVAAAIFPRIPLVTDWLRHHEEVIKRIDCTLTFDPHYSNFRWKETVTLFQGDVAAVDWRGRSQ